MIHSPLSSKISCWSSVGHSHRVPCRYHTTPLSSYHHHHIHPYYFPNYHCLVFSFSFSSFSFLCGTRDTVVHVEQDYRLKTCSSLIRLISIILRLISTAPSTTTASIWLWLPLLLLLLLLLLESLLFFEEELGLELALLYSHVKKHHRWVDISQVWWNRSYHEFHGRDFTFDCHKLYPESCAVWCWSSVGGRVVDVTTSYSLLLLVVVELLFPTVVDWNRVCPVSFLLTSSESSSSSGFISSIVYSGRYWVDYPPDHYSGDVVVLIVPTGLS